MSKLIVQVRLVGGGDYQIHFDEDDECNIESAIRYLEEKISENEKALNYAKTVFKEKVTPEIEKTIKEQIKVRNEEMKKEIERLEMMLMNR